MGINVLNNSSSQEVRLTAGAALASGDLVVNTEAGTAYPASTGLTMAQNNNTTAGAAAIYAITASTSGGYTGSSGDQNGGVASMAQLSTGTIVNVYSGNNSSDTNQNVNISFRNLQGGTTYPNITISDSCYSARVRKIGTTGFLVAWTTASSVLKFAIYSNTGSSIATTTTVATLSNYLSYLWNVEVNTNGDIVFAYDKSATGGIEFTRYNSSGVIQGTATAVEASVSTNMIRVLPQSNGGFYVYYLKSTGSAWKFGRYNSSGVLQGSVTTVMSGSSLSYGSTDYLAFELSGGNVVFLGSTTSTYPYFSIYDASGTNVITTTRIGVGSATQTYQGVIPALSQQGSGFLSVTMGTGGIYLNAYDSTGANLYANLKTATGPSSINTVNFTTSIQVVNLGSNIGIFANQSRTTCGTLWYSMFWVCNAATGVTVGTSITFYSGGSTDIQDCYGLLTSDGSFAVKYTVGNTSNGNQYYGTYAVQRKSVIGVAQEAIAAGSSGRVATVGTYPLTASFSAGSNFDQRTATVPGSKGTVAGSTAVLFGMN